MPDRLFRFCGGKFPPFPRKIAENLLLSRDKCEFYLLIFCELAKIA